MTRQLLSYFPVIVACKYFKMFNSFINTYKINLDSFCGLSSKQKKLGEGGGLNPLSKYWRALAPPALLQPPMSYTYTTCFDTQYGYVETVAKFTVTCLDVTAQCL